MTKAMKAALVFLAVAVVFVAGVGVLLVIRHVQQPQQPATQAPVLAGGYLYTATGSVTYLRVLEDAHGRVSGLWYGVLKNTNSTLSTYNGSFSGTQKGTQLVLSFTGVGGDTDTGRIASDGSTLTLQVFGTDGKITDVVYSTASIAQFNAAVAALGGK